MMENLSDNGRDILNTTDDDPAVEVDIPYLNSSEDCEGKDNFMEEILLGNTCLEVPADLYENESIFNQFFSIDTWNDLMSEEVKIGLLNLLPSFPNNDIDEKAKTIEMLFGKENFHFGNPLVKFRQDLLEGNYFPDNVAMKEMLTAAQKRNYEEWMDNYNHSLVQEILESRKKVLEKATGNIVTTPKIDRKRTGKGGNMRTIIKKRYLEEIGRIKQEVGEDGLSSDDECYVAAHENPKIEVETDSIIDNDQLQHMKENIPLEQIHDTDDTNSSEIYQSPQRSLTQSHMDTPLTPVTRPIFQSSPAQDLLSSHSLLTQNVQPCFLSLLRDLFLTGPDNSLTMPQLDKMLSQWQDSPIAALNSWYQECLDPNGWRSNIASAVAFLCGSFPDQTPNDFLPFIQVDSVTGTYKWIGTGRDYDSIMTSLNTWWMNRLESCRAGFVSQTSSGSTGDSLPQPGNTTSWQVRPSTLEERQQFQEEERRRYANPDQPFQWTCHGYSALVGPVKSFPGSGQSRPKNHVMLQPERSPLVTILTLVRDAVSRLPNGEGTRTDIVELLKDSQYLVDGIDSNNLTTTVSGALDRLQNEPDAPVKYDSNRKIWIYLHRARTPDDFVKAIQDIANQPGSKQARQRQKRKIKLEMDQSPTMDVPSILETALAGAGLRSQEISYTKQTTSSDTHSIPHQSSFIQNKDRISLKEGEDRFVNNLSQTQNSNSSQEKNQMTNFDHPGHIRATDSQTPQGNKQLSPVKVSPNKTVQKIIVKGTDGKVIPLSAATLQKLIEAGAIKPGTQIATPGFLPGSGSRTSSIRVVQPRSTPGSSSEQDS